MLEAIMQRDGFARDLAEVVVMWWTASEGGGALGRQGGSFVHQRSASSPLVCT